MDVGLEMSRIMASAMALASSDADLILCYIERLVYRLIINSGE
jgi:hypothetical protein